ncbi:MAG: glucosyltransferase domain-containing protein [Lachnospiraceae bacterium]|nr:glucosyltransferase domain-containing protein [Lachnospiraceae bacterium]
MIKDLLKHNKIYWILLILTTIVCYGFKLTQYSMHFEDLLFENYQYSSNIIMGRWGMTPFYDIIYMPIWRTIIALIVLVMAVTLLAGLLRKYSYNCFDDKSLTIFACITISFPAFSTYFIMVCTTFDIGMMFLLSAASLYFAAKWVIDKGHFINAIFAVLTLCYATGFFEYAVFLYLIFGFLLLFVHEIFSPSTKFNWRTHLMMIAKKISIVILAFSAWRLVGLILQKIYGLSANIYIDGSVGHETNNIFALFISLLKYALAFPKEYLKSFAIPKDNISTMNNLLIFVSAILFVLIAAVLSLQKKRFMIFVYCLFTLVFVYSIYIIGGGVDFMFRRLVHLSVFVAFMAALLYVIAGRKMRFLVCAAVVYLVILQTKEQTLIFDMDYKRYQKDIHIMETIVYDLGKFDQNKPLAFTGEIPRLNIKGVDSHIQTFSLGSEITKLFFDFHGYPIMISNLDERIISEQAQGMSAWPADGYIKDFDDYIIIKLGNLPRKQLDFGEILETTEMLQIFTLPDYVAGNLAIEAISLYMTTFGYGSNANLFVEFGADEVISQSTINAVDIKNNRMLRIDFAEPYMPTGSAYYLKLHSDAKPGNAVTVWALAGKSEDESRVLFINGDEVLAEIIFEIHLSDGSSIIDAQVLNWRATGWDMHGRRFGK